MSVLYSTKVKVSGGRTGHAESTDGLFKLDLVSPKELGGEGGGTNPEQLFAAGYAACFESALRHVAMSKKIPISDTSVLATVTLNSDAEKGFYLTVDLQVELKGIDQKTAEDLVEKTHTVCPYSKAIHGNVDVQLNTKVK